MAIYYLAQSTKYQNPSTLHERHETLNNISLGNPWKTSHKASQVTNVK